MIEFNNAKKELKFSTVAIPQLNGDIVEEIKVDKYNSSWNYFLEFKCPQNETFISEPIEFLDNIGKIVIYNRIFKNVGKVFVQLVMRNTKGTIVNKSLLSDNPLYIIEKSINANVYLDEERVNDCLEYFINAENALLEKIDEQEKRISLIAENNIILKELINNKAQFDLLWSGVWAGNTIVTIDNQNIYKYLIFMGRCGGSVGTAIMSKQTSDCGSSFCSVGNVPKLFCFSIKRLDNNQFKIENIGMYGEGFKYINLKENTQYNYIYAVYGIR